MSVPYHKEIFNSGIVKLFVNFSKIKGDVADESITLHFYATDSHGTPVFTENLGIKDIRKLYKHLDSISIIRDGTTESSKFVETSDEIALLLDQLKESDLITVLNLLEKFESQEKVKGLLESLSELEIMDLHGAFHHKLISEEIALLEELITLEENGNITEEIKTIPRLSKYVAGQPERIFQNWIESNLWVFGVDYIKRHDARKIALFSEGDILMESVDGYLDLIELKRPKHALLKYDQSHKCYFPHPDLSQVIGQSLFYLQKLDEYKLNLEREYDIKILKPRIRIITGNSNGFEPAQKDCLRMLNSNLNSIQIVTYNDLLSFGRLLLATYEKSSKV